MIELRPYQSAIVESIRNAYREGFNCPLLRLDTGGGKCHGKNTPIMMFDGTIKMVQDVVVGDLLMGPDSKPRTVLSLARGREMLYQVVPTKGDPYVVNESHVLSLRQTNTSSTPEYPSQNMGGNIVNISVSDYLKKSDRFKHIHKGWRAAVDFEKNHKLDDVIEPYFLGAWLGDGTSRQPEITTGDYEIVDYLREYAERHSFSIAIKPNSENSVNVRIKEKFMTGRRGTRIMNAFRKIGIVMNKHIPHCYKTSSKSDRLELLAGLLDTDGYYTGKGFDLTLSNERLLDDAIFVARSLGFSAYKSPSKKTCYNNGVSGDYWRCTISGDVEKIPCKILRKKAKPREQKKNVLNVGIKVEPIGVGDYYGFAIDGDHLYLLGDFTVTHNTVIFSYIAKSVADRGGSPWIMAHRRELISQISQSLALFGVKHAVIADASTVRKLRIKHFKTFGKVFIDQTASATVASVQTIAKLLKNPNMKSPTLIIMDEAHHVISGNQWGAVFERFPDCKKLKVTATPERTDGRGLGAGFGGYADTIIHGPTMKWLIANNYLSPYQVYGSDSAIDTSEVSVTKSEFNQHELENAAGGKAVVGDAIAHYKEYAYGMRAVAFCVSISRSKELAEAFTAEGIPAIHVDGDMEDDEREAAIAGYADGKYMVMCNQALVSEGFDLASIAQKAVTIDCVIDLSPTMSVIKFMQSWGRALRPAPGKTAIILDHANNWKRHGFPHFEREWTLQGREKGKRRKQEDMEADVLIRKCPKCAAVHEPEPACPVCGFIYPKQEREVKEVDGHLGALDMAEIERRQRMAQRIQQAQAQTVEDMVANLGYSKGRAEKIAEARAVKAAMQEEATGLLNDYTRQTGISSWRGLGVNMSDVKKLKPKALKELIEKVKVAIDEQRNNYSESLLS